MDFVVKEEKGFKYIEQGEGKVLLLLHGLMGALSNWQQVIEEFSKTYRVIVPMLPIYELPLLTLGVKSLTKFVQKFIRYKELEDFIILGNSVGGHIGLVYAITYPEKIKAMVLTGSSGLYENAFGGSFPRRKSYEFIKGKVEYTFYDPKTATKELVDDVYESVNNRHKMLRLLAMAKSAIRHNMAKELHKIHVPVSLIWGKNDKITPPEVAVEFSQLLPNAELTWVDHCGHVPMMERPEEFNRLLKGFLENIKA